MNTENKTKRIVKKCNKPSLFGEFRIFVKEKKQQKHIHLILKIINIIAIIVISFLVLDYILTILGLETGIILNLDGDPYGWKFIFLIIIFSSIIGYVIDFYIIFFTILLIEFILEKQNKMNTINNSTKKEKKRGVVLNDK